MKKPGIPADATGRLAADHAEVLGRFGGDGIAHGGLNFRFDREMDGITGRYYRVDLVRELANKVHWSVLRYSPCAVDSGSLGIIGSTGFSVLPAA